MSLSVNMIPINELSMLETALYDYADSHNEGGISSVCDMSHYLRFWETNKNNLFTLLSEQLTLKFPVDIHRNLFCIVQEMEERLCNNRFWSKMYDFNYDYAYGHPVYGGHYGSEYSRAYPYNIDTVNSLAEVAEESAVFKAYRNRSEVVCCLNNLLNTTTLARNVYEGKTFSMIAPNADKVITFHKGEKAMKIFGKIVKTYFADDRQMQDDWEEFRIAHSMCLNQSRLVGNLCLSIHPLDFATMSDNTYDWDSCMSWMNFGDYRLGTVEMMNSDCVICAYFEGDRTMDCYGGTWNSKRWRQLFVVNEDVILANRPYPYDNADLTTMVFDILRDLAAKNWNHHDFSAEIFTFDAPHGEVDLGNGDKVLMSFETNYMYNDVRNYHKVLINKNMERNFHHTFNFSGEAVCAQCGRVINPDEDTDPGMLACCDCAGGHRCEECGDWCSDEYAYCVDGVWYCEYCYSHYAVECADCHEMMMDGYANIDFCWGGTCRESINMCRECYEHMKTQVGSWFHEHSWGGGGKVDMEELHASNTTLEDGLSLFGLSEWTIHSILSDIFDD